jgi:gamma-glutamylaminecyclotransferase
MKYDDYTTLAAFYGSLKKGGRLNRVIERGGGRYLGVGQTVPGYKMFDCGAYPAMVVCAPEDGPGVWCELYEMGDNLVAEIDRIEGHPTYYRRSDVALQVVNLAYLPLGQRVFEQFEKKVVKSYVYQPSVQRSMVDVGSFYQNLES